VSASLISQKPAPAAAGRVLVDLCQSPNGWVWNATNLTMLAAGGLQALNGFGNVNGAAVGSAVTADGLRWNSLLKSSLSLASSLTLPMIAGTKYARALMFEISSRLRFELGDGSLPFRPAASDLNFGVQQGANSGQMMGPQQVADTPGVAVGITDQAGGLSLYRREAGAPYGSGALTKTPLAIPYAWGQQIDVRWRIRAADLVNGPRAELAIDGAVVTEVILPPLYGVIRMYYPAWVSSTDQNNTLLFRDARFRVIEY
jgi:hypothetical protein